MALGPDGLPGRVTVGLVGGGKGGLALLDLLLDWPVAKVAVVVDPRAEAPAIGKARTLRIPTAAHHLDVFAHPVDLVLEVTGQRAVLDDLLRAKPAGVEIIGAGSLRFFWDVLQDKVKAGRQLAAQLDMALVLGSTLDLTQQLALVTRKLAQACAVDRCAFYLWGEGTEVVVPVMSQFATGETDERMWTAFRDHAKLKLAEVPFLCEVVERRGPIEIEDPASNPLVPEAWGDFFEMKSLLVVPIFRKDLVVGACLLDYRYEARRFTRDQIALAIALSGQIALALENARLYQDVTEKAGLLASLLESTKRTAVIKDSRQLLRWIAQEAAVFLKADGGGIRILEGETLTLAAHYRFQRERLRERIGLGESGTGWVVLHNQPLAISDLQQDSRVFRQHRAVYREEGFRSLLAVPMRIAEHAIGALFVLSKTPRHFSATEIEVLSGFADQAALALENARLFEEAERRRREAEVLAEIARSFNVSLDLNTVLQRVAEGAKDLCRSDMAKIALRDPRSEAMVFRSLVGARYQGYETFRIEAGKGSGGQVLLTGRPFRTDHYAEDPRISKDYLEVAREEEIVSEMVAPIWFGDRVEGLLFVQNRVPRPFTDQDEAILLRLADHAAIAIQNARLYEETERRRREAESLADVGRLISQSLDPEEVGQRIADIIRGLCTAQNSALYRLDPASGDLVALAVSGDVGPIFGQNLVFPRGTGVAGLAVRESQPVVTPDLLTDSRITLTAELRARIEKAAYRSVLAVPLLVKDKVIGALAVGDRPRRVFDEEEIRLAQAFANQAALALENARLYADATRRQREAEELAQVARTLTEHLDVAAVGQRIVDSVIPLFGVHGSVLRLLQPDGSLVATASGGPARNHFEPGHVLPPGVGVVGRAVTEGRPIGVRDVLDEPGLVLSDNLRVRIERSQTRAVLTVPLRVKGRIFGTLTIGDRARREFSEAEVALLQTFADQAALALENARLFEEQSQLLEETRRQHEEAVALGEVAREITSSLERGEILQRIVDRARQLCGSDLAFLAPYDRETDTARIVAASGARSEALRSVTITPGRGTGGRVLETGEPFTTEDYLGDPRITKDYAEAAIQEGFVSQAVVPLRFRGATTGLLWVVNRSPRRFASRDLAVLTKLADQAAIALENARLFAELRAALEQVEASQQRIVQTERLRALGEMAAGVAHDFNNLLAVILGRAELLLARTQDPDVARALDAVRIAALDGAQTVRRIQEFTRTRRTRPFGRVDLWELLREVVELTRPRWENEAQSRGVAYDVRVEGGPVPPVAGISEELREVFTNLLVNALEAMPAGGRFVFRVTTEADHAVLIAEDTGCGMSDETRRRVFEPFFTTKGPRGTGLGLAVVWGIIYRHGGTIEVESDLGGGSRFTIRLPIGQEIPAEEKVAPLPHAGQEARVLVIDDEQHVREVMRDLLTEHGYTVIQAADGAEGLARCESERIHLVLSDLSMPGMSGWEVAAACRERFPKVPVGFITGWGDQLDSHQLERHRVRFVLAKPFVASDVLQQVARALKEAEPL